MNDTLAKKIESHEEDSQKLFSKTIFGFWVYLMTDCILFATLFATYVVLHNQTAGGPDGQSLFSLPFALAETLILLTSSFTCGLGLLGMHKFSKAQVYGWFSITFLLGAVFLSMELTEFSDFIESGNSWQRSAFLSSFFTLVATHGLHITIGLIWIMFMMFQIAIRGIGHDTIRKMTCLGLFWHFLDVIWIFIFTIVYLGSHLN